MAPSALKRSLIALFSSRKICHLPPEKRSLPPEKRSQGCPRGHLRCELWVLISDSSLKNIFVKMIFSSFLPIHLFSYLGGGGAPSAPPRSAFNGIYIKLVMSLCSNHSPYETNILYHCLIKIYTRVRCDLGRKQTNILNYIHREERT